VSSLWYAVCLVIDVDGYYCAEHVAPRVFVTSLKKADSEAKVDVASKSLSNEEDGGVGTSENAVENVIETEEEVELTFCFGKPTCVSCYQETDMDIAYDSAIGENDEKHRTRDVNLRPLA
jgi:hypothetical protein